MLLLYGMKIVQRWETLFETIYFPYNGAVQNRSRDYKFTICNILRLQ